MRLAGVLLCALLAGCTEAGPPEEPPVPGAMPGSAAGPSSRAGWGGTSASASPSPSPSRGPSPPAVLSKGWEVTVYYTAVEEYHSGDAETVTGCPGLDCAHGDEDLGEYRSGFVAAVREEGTGRTADGRYLNWSYDVGFWLDTQPRDTGGRRLRPFVSAAADPGVLARGTRFRIAGCGRTDDGSRPAEPVCKALRDARWTVTDEFTPGLGGNRHLDAYIGEETGPDFTSSPWYLTLRGATLRWG
ncbi:hypothetical protein Asp14428_09320 [Actinoplanes sp. NBRC 14428]|nr:hypothetical protein Asp14428_09320 [Actinoplanes sp. NBRC 14428]